VTIDEVSKSIMNHGATQNYWISAPSGGGFAPTGGGCTHSGEIAICTNSDGNLSGAR